MDWRCGSSSNLSPTKIKTPKEIYPDYSNTCVCLFFPTPPSVHQRQHFLYLTHHSFDWFWIVTWHMSSPLNNTCLVYLIWDFATSICKFLWLFEFWILHFYDSPELLSLDVGTLYNVSIYPFFFWKILGLLPVMFAFFLEFFLNFFKFCCYYAGGWAWQVL
jgi:hypothetical protein